MCEIACATSAHRVWHKAKKHRIQGRSWIRANGKNIATTTTATRTTKRKGKYNKEKDRGNLCHAKSEQVKWPKIESSVCCYNFSLVSLLFFYDPLDSIQKWANANIKRRMRSRGKVTTWGEKKKKKKTNPNWSAATIVCALGSVCTFVLRRVLYAMYNACIVKGENSTTTATKKKKKEKSQKNHKKICNDAVGTNV